MKTIEREVIVVGSGPAGAACAAYLAKAGIDVLLLDKELWPRDKPCGDNQSGHTWELLEDLGVADRLAAMGHLPKGMAFSSPDYTFVKIDATNPPQYCTPRRIFDDMMRKYAIEVGADMIENAWVYDLIMEDGFVKGVKAKIDGEFQELRAKTVIGADGSHSIIAKKLGMFNEDGSTIGQAGRCYYADVQYSDYIEVHLDKTILPGYVWVFPEEDGLANVGLGFARNDMTHEYIGMGLEELLNYWIENSPLAEPIRKGKRVGKFKGWRIPNALGAQGNSSDGVMLIGDAASMVEPFTGEGVAHALLAAKIAAWTAGRALKAHDSSLAVLKEYSEIYESMTREDDLKLGAMKEKAFTDIEACNAAVRSFRDDPAMGQAMISVPRYVKQLNKILKDKEARV